MIFFPEDFRETDGRFRDLMPGDFVPILYKTESGTRYCSDCINEWKDVIDPIRTHCPEWRLAGYLLHYEGAPIVCEGCDRIIESMFGEVIDEGRDPRS